MYRIEPHETRPSKWRRTSAGVIKCGGGGGGGGGSSSSLSLIHI